VLEALLQRALHLGGGAVVEPQRQQPQDVLRERDRETVRERARMS
jgi:hypothetical protein